MQVKTTLYKKASKGYVQQWKVFVENNKITVEFGQVGGKLQTKDTFCKGKNIGRSNATTDDEQALSEATAKWEKQVKKGYVKSSSGERLINLPMKVEAYFKGKMKDKIKFPATTGRKLNGVNAECRIILDEFHQLSRGGENYPLPPQDAQNELIEVMNLLETDSINYEIYRHGEHLQDITGAVKAPHKHPELWQQLEYHIFDLPTYGEDWLTRCSILQQVALKKFKYVKFVENYRVDSHEDIIRLQDKFVEEKYEGSVVRNYDGVYQYNKRTMDVLKVKYVQSDEFKITSYEVDKNSQPVFLCDSINGQFKVKPKGTKEQRSQILQEANSWIGKWMTVEYEMLSKDGIPLKPVGIGLREGYVNDEGDFTPTE